MTTTQHTSNPNTTTTSPRRSTRLRSAAAISMAAAIAIGAIGVGSAEAASHAPADVTCSTSMRTIKVTPKVLADQEGQWVASRIWLAKWNGAAWTWQNPTQWSVEQAHNNNNPMGAPIDRLATKTITSNGSSYYLVYTQSYLWNGNSQSWYGAAGTYASSYTQSEPSVSHEPGRSSTAWYCSA
jgi:hypothetical protein